MPAAISLSNQEVAESDVLGRVEIWRNQGKRYHRDTTMFIGNRLLARRPQMINGIPHGIAASVLAVAGGPVKRRLARWAKLLPVIAAFEKEFRDRSDQELRKASLSLR